ncbi:hypothetical protein [Klenkia sp. PcliD-1-E]|nr:hypothetical protein [Klenkia sp. PcliD-1-E]MCO7220988.1 hypothetical protein [Klenkia sp. PcliD-1-E]
MTGVGATEAPRRELTEDGVAAVVRAGRDERLAAAAEELRAAAAVLDGYL